VAFPRCSQVASLTGLAEFGYTPEKKKVCSELIKLPFLKVGYHTVISRLSTHLFKYAFFGKKFKVQNLLVEHVINCHLM